MKVVKLILVLFVMVCCCMVNLSYGSTAALKVSKVNGISYSGPSMAVVSPGDIVSVVGWTDFPVLQIQAWSVNDNGDLRAGGSPALGFVSNGWLASGWEDGGNIWPRGANNNGWLYYWNIWSGDALCVSGNDIAPYDKQGALWGFDYKVPTLVTPKTLTISCFDLTAESGVSGAWDAQRVRFDWSPLQLSVVPEPATISILSLGGLAFLRRRK